MQTPGGPGGWTVPCFEVSGKEIDKHEGKNTLLLGHKTYDIAGYWPQHTED